MDKSIRQYLEDAIRHYRAAQFEEGLAACDKAIQLDPKCARAYHGRGLILAQQKKYEEALENYKRSFQLEPENAKLHADLGELFYAKLDFKKSWLYYRKAILLDSKYESDYNRKLQELISKALNLSNSGMLNEAVSTLQQALLFNPEDNRARSILSKLQVKNPPNTNGSSGASHGDSIPSIHTFDCRCVQCWEP